MLSRSNPHTVTVPGGKIPLIIAEVDAKSLPTTFALLGTKAGQRVAVRLSGGCKNMSQADKDGMLAFFTQAFQGFQGVVWSGATRQVDGDGMLDPMVTDVPGLIAAENEGCVALGSVPRVHLLTLQGDSRLVLDQWGTIPNPTQHGILIVQDGPDRDLGWDGDVDMYFRLMEQWRDYANFSAVGVIGWNGGAVTGEEIMRSAKLGWPTILIKGSGRATDEIVGKLESGDESLLSQFPAKHQVVVVSKDEPQALREELRRYGFIS
jgi:hypothetical protein